MLAGLTVKPAAAASWAQWYGQNCGGIQVSRCAWLDYDRAAGLIRAGGNTRDEIGGGNYSVAVNDTMAQVLPFGGPWTTIDGTAFDLASLRGRPVIVNFWGPGCVPCRDEFPLFITKLAATDPRPIP